MFFQPQLRKQKIMIIAATLAIISCTQASDFNDLSKGSWGAETYIFGATRHSNRNVDYNEKNYGIGIGIFYRTPENDIKNVYSNTDVTFIAGTYIDSYGEHAKFIMPGLRFTFGNPNTFHSSLGVNAGYFVGSDMIGFGIIPSATIGFNRFDLCVTGYPNFDKGTQVEDRDPKSNRHSGGGFVTMFIKITLATW